MLKKHKARAKRRAASRLNRRALRSFRKTLCSGEAAVSKVEVVS